MYGSKCTTSSGLRRALAFFILFLGGAWPARSEAFSGFLKEQYSGYVKISFDTLRSTDLYSTEGELLSTSGEFTQNNLSLYAELGVLDYLTVGLSAPVLRFNSFDTSEVATGFGDLQVFAKSGLQLFGIHGALITAVEFPTGRSEALVDTDFDGIQTNLPTGDGETNIWVRLAFSYEIPTPDWLSAYASIHGGFNWRSEFAEQFQTGLELGFNPGGWVWIQGKLDALFTPTATEDLEPAGIFLFGEGTEYVAAGVSASVRIPETPLWVTFDYRNTFANLRNLYAGSTFGGGIAADW